jgi:hypothetical protein
MGFTPFGQDVIPPTAEKYSLAENLFLFAEGVKNLSEGHRFS